MKTKRFEYHNKNVPMLKKEIAFRLLFTLLFFVTFIWQFAFILREYSLGTLTTLKSVVSIIVLIVTLVFTIVTLVYAYRCINVMSSIKLHGKAVRFITILSDNKKGSFLKLYSLMNRFITLVMALALVSGITYSILELIYYSSISFYIPILFFVAISGFNSVYHIKAEIQTIKEVQEYNSIY